MIVVHHSFSCYFLGAVALREEHPGCLVSLKSIIITFFVAKWYKEVIFSWKNVEIQHLPNLDQHFGSRIVGQKYSYRFAHTMEGTLSDSSYGDRYWYRKKPTNLWHIAFWIL